jgi:hypothetical protein
MCSIDPAREASDLDNTLIVEGFRMVRASPSGKII